MRPLYFDTHILEKEAKRRFHIPECIMMENAAAALEKEVLSAIKETARKNDEKSTEKKEGRVVIICGTGNNGGDGYALSRRLFGKCAVLVVAFGEPGTDEARRQAHMATSCGVRILSAENTNSLEFETTLDSAQVFVDCLYGTGFHGKLDKKAAAFIEKINAIEGRKIACDIPSGLDLQGCVFTENSGGEKIAFTADRTITMGALKTALFSDVAKDFTGRIEVAELGISAPLFEGCISPSSPSILPDAFLLDETDIKLPVRSKNNCHKGHFGHCAVVVGEKAGAAIIAGTAALKSGAGLATCVDFGKRHAFLMNPELIEEAAFPEKTSAVLLGSGLGRENEETLNSTLDFIFQMKNPSCVLDADFFYYEKAAVVLERLCKMEDARVILTPHPKELFALAKNCGMDEITETYAVEMRFETAKKIASFFPTIVLIAKGANTIIARGNELVISDFGSPALSKAGSGDVLAGFCAGLMAQGYNALESAKTAVSLQGKASSLFENRWELSPLDLVRHSESVKSTYSDSSTGV